MISDRIFFSHQTACLFWSHHDLFAATPTRCTPCPNDPPIGVSLIDARRYVIGLDESSALHVIVHPQHKRQHVEGASLHSRTEPFPDFSFYKVAAGIYVACPELCFLQSATFLQFDDLVLYGLELCGTYARTTSQFGARYKITPLTTTARLGNYLNKCKGTAKCSAALRALRYIADGSASPRESQLVTILAMPPRLGGFGLPMPQLNFGIEVNRPDMFNPGRNLILHGDIVWPEAQLVVEYDGSQHGLEDNHASDKQRDHLLLDAGYQVVRFTNRQINDPVEIARLAKTINRRAHLRRPASSLATDSRKLAAQHDILHKSAPPWISNQANLFSSTN